MFIAYLLSIEGGDKDEDGDGECEVVHGVGYLVL